MPYEIIATQHATSSPFEGHGSRGEGAHGRAAAAPLTPLAPAPLPPFAPPPALPALPHIRPATPGDLAFIDALQKRHSKMVGWFPTAQLESYIAGGHVLIAERGGRPASGGPGPASATAAGPTPDAGPGALDSPLGYAIAKDRYTGRDEVGIIYQINVAPGCQRRLVGADLVRAVFARAAYGCRLFGCWCAQDLEANHFWASLGFVPLAFRAGSRGKKRIHIYWQGRVRAGDETTPWWFPAQTRNGAVREDRLVLPIPPGTDWRDAKPLIFPELQPPAPGSLSARLPAAREEQRKLRAAADARARHLQAPPPGKAALITSGGLRYIERSRTGRGDAKRSESNQREKPRVSRPKADPRHVAVARELRDRYLEHLSGAAPIPGLPALTRPHPRHDVTRAAVSIGERLPPPLPRIAAA